MPSKLTTSQFTDESRGGQHEGGVVALPSYLVTWVSSFISLGVHFPSVSGDNTRAQPPGTVARTNQFITVKHSVRGIRMFAIITIL